jgi:hypothetical protein
MAIAALVEGIAVFPVVQNPKAEGDSQLPSGDFLYRQNEFLVVLIAFALLLAATEIGFRRGQALAPGLSNESKSQLSTLQAALIGLLALLLAFSFAMAESRFDTRQRLVIEEANAIGTASLRSRLLPEPYHNQIMQTLRDYVDTRLAYHESSSFDPVINQVLVRTQTEQKELWSEAVAAVKTNPGSPLYALFISSLNDAIDLQAKRVAARENHVPQIVFGLLFLVAATSMLLVGLGCGVGNRRHLPFTISVGILISLVILVIMDLDRPRRGIIEVNQASMIALRESLK